MGQVIVVFPHSGLQNALTDGHRRWMSRGTVQIKTVATEPLADVLVEIGLPRLSDGLAALRYLGQTGRATDGWIAAADPISFEPRMRDIVARRIAPGQLSVEEFAEVMSAARDLLANDNDLQLESIEHQGYLASSESMPTATISSSTLHGFGPDEYLPSGGDGRLFHRLNSELQMLFHDHPVNERRAERGLPAINGLWMWGGGRMPAESHQDLPVLIGDDPLFKGYWKHFGGQQNGWSGNIGDCIRAAGRSAVITVPASTDSAFDQDALGYLDQICDQLKGRRMSKLTMIFNNEVINRLHWADRLKFWRRQSPLFPEAAHDE
ncbi:MAG: hypothetical protein ACR2QR_07925 [Woeseiaceae bacterium]